MVKRSESRRMGWRWVHSCSSSLLRKFCILPHTPINVESAKVVSENIFFYKTLTRRVENPLTDFKMVFLFRTPV